MDVLLIGAGHAHLGVLRDSQAFRRRGIGLTLVSPPRFWYSGMASEMLAGGVAMEEATLDLQRVCEAWGCRYLDDSALGLDAPKRTVLLASGRTQSYDAVSWAVGSEPRFPDVPGARELATPLKPFAGLLDLRRRLLQSESRDVAILGGGPSGCEIAGNLERIRAWAPRPFSVHLLSSKERLLEGYPKEAGRRAERILRERGVKIHLGVTVTEIRAGRVSLLEAEPLPADEVVLASGLIPSRVLRSLGLPLDVEGHLRIKPTLQSIADERVFAAGDCAQIENAPLPKVGVFGVRQGPVLARNLAAFLTGRPLEAFRPQKRYLLILNLGKPHGLAIRGSLVWETLALPLKSRLDERFMRRLRRGG